MSQNPVTFCLKGVNCDKGQVGDHGFLDGVRNRGTARPLRDNIGETIPLPVISVEGGEV
jgi:hypothetical protein